jgi:hypothetical protein
MTLTEIIAYGIILFVIALILSKLTVDAIILAIIIIYMVAGNGQTRNT